MVKLLLKDYKMQISKKILKCDKCQEQIEKNTAYYKYSQDRIFHRLHIICYMVLSIESAYVNIKTLRDLNATK